MATAPPAGIDRGGVGNWGADITLLGAYQHRARFYTMTSHSPTGPIERLRRKLRAVSAIAADPAATPHEKANAKALKARLQRQLDKAGVPAGDWTDTVFRLGKWANDWRRAIAPTSPKGDWTDHAHRLGKALRRGYKSWFDG